MGRRSLERKAFRLSEVVRRHFVSIVLLLLAVALGPYYFGEYFSALLYLTGVTAKTKQVFMPKHVTIAGSVYSGITLAKSQGCTSVCEDMGPCPDGVEHCVVARKASSFLNGQEELVALRLEQTKTCALASSGDYERYRSGELKDFLLQSQFPLYLDDPWGYRPRDSYLDNIIEKALTSTPLPNITRTSDWLPRILSLGVGGGGKVAHTFSQLLPFAKLDVVEADQARLEALEDWFCRPYVGWFRYIHKDPLVYLDSLPASERKYDLVIVDTFQGSPLQGKLLTEDFFRKLKQHVSEGALVSIHVVPASLVQEKSLERKATNFFSKVEVQMFQEHALLHLSA